MTDTSTEGAQCRGCGMALKGNSYHLGGHAYHPRTGKWCPANYYGGFVCSRECDHRASLRLEESMPGCAGQKKLTGYAQRVLENNWPTGDSL